MFLEGESTFWIIAVSNVNLIFNITKINFITTTDLQKCCFYDHQGAEVTQWGLQGEATSQGAEEKQQHVEMNGWCRDVEILTHQTNTNSPHCANDEGAIKDQQMKILNNFLCHINYFLSQLLFFS